MASNLTVDTIRNSSGSTVLMEDGVRQYAPGQIIECLAGICDGQTIQGVDRSYTWPNVTSAQTGISDTTYQDATGSVIQYQPPAAATKVIYSYRAMFAWVHDHCISHWKLYIDGTEVVDARNSRSGRYMEEKTALEWIFPIGGTADTDTGRQATWTSLKEIKWQVRDYGGSNERDRLHLTQYWDGGGTDVFSRPMLTITAIA